ncbi:MAG: TRAP transporter large permease [Sphaerochaetaceae bacterium]
MLYVILTLGLIILLAMGIPVGFSLLLTGAIGYLVNIGDIGTWMEMTILPMKMSYSLQNFLLLSIPLFILAAKVMNGSSITKKLFGFANVCVGWLPGGLGHANIFASLLFAGMSGTATSDAAGLGQIEIEAMKQNGYDADFSAAVTAASTTIGPIFPPSVPMVMYSTISGVSVGKLFLGGIVPGILLTIVLMIMVYFYARKRDYPREAVPTWPRFWNSFKAAIFPILTPIILLSGIWSGMFTATEAAAIAALYALLVSVFIFKEMTWKLLLQILKETARDTASIGLVVAAAAFYGWVLARSGLTVAFADWILGLTSNRILFMLLVNLFFLVIGCFLESIAAITIFGPVMLAPALQLGIDPLFFGVIMVFNLMIGLVTPPFGIVLFITADQAKISFHKMVKATIPFLIPLLVMLILMSVIPGIVTGLPNLLM